MEINRLMPNVCSKDLQESKRFYTSLFAFEVNYDSDWFVHLISEGRKLELGIISADHDIVPEEVRGKSSGFFLTFVVPDVHETYAKAQELGYPITQAPQNTFYGQERMLLTSPEGTICDVSSLM